MCGQFVRDAEYSARGVADVQMDVSVAAWPQAYMHMLNAKLQRTHSCIKKVITVG